MSTYVYLRCEDHNPPLTAEDTFEKVCRQFISNAQRAEVSTHGHECGHRFEITVRSAMHASCVESWSRR